MTGDKQRRSGLMIAGELPSTEDGDGWQEGLQNTVAAGPGVGQFQAQHNNSPSVQALCGPGLGLGSGALRSQPNSSALVQIPLKF